MRLNDKTSTKTGRLYILDRFATLFICFSALAVLALLLLNSALYADVRQPRHFDNKMAQVDILKAVPAIARADSVKYLGFTNKNTFLFVVNYSVISGLGSLKWINPHSGKVIRSVPTDRLNPTTLILSSDGQTIFGIDDSVLLLGKINIKPIVNHVRVFQSTNLNPIGAVDIGPSRCALGVGEVSGKPGQFIVRAYSLVPYEESSTSADPGLELWDWQKSRLINRLYYRPASKIVETLFSPDNRELCCIFVDKERNIEGSIQVLDPLNGKRLWWTQGDDQKPVSDPIFFLPNGYLVGNNTVYDLKNLNGSPLISKHPDFRCVSGALSRFNLVFFQSDAGLELWNIRSHILVKRWLQIKDVVAVYISPDLSTMAVLLSPDKRTGEWIPYMKKPIIQFWSFDQSLVQNR